MYSPKIREELIPIIYREAKKKKVPMTTFVSDIIYNHFYHLPEEQEIGLQSNNKRSKAEQPKDNRNLTIDATANSVFVIGDRVFHQKFGYGKIQEIEGDKLKIEFEKAGNKKVVSKFIVLAEDI